MRNIISTRKRRFLATGVATVIVGVLGFAFAQWTSTGTGSGYAQAGHATNLSTQNVSADVTTLSNQLYPTKDGDVLIQVHNPNPYPVTVTQVSQGAGSVTGTGGLGTCTTTGVSIPTAVTTSISVAASSDSTETTLTNAAHMDNTSDNGCQDATFTIPVSLSGHSG
jgi:hypothetical protein